MLIPGKYKGGEKTVKVSIDGHVFDTSKVKWHASLNYFDGHNQIYGDVYESSTGIFYVYTPSEWSNMHRWEIQTPGEIIENYLDMLGEDAVDHLIRIGKINVE